MLLVLCSSSICLPVRMTFPILGFKDRFSQYLFIEKVGRDRLGNQSQADCRKPLGAIANLIISMTVFILVFTKCSHLSDSQHKNL